MNYDLYSVESSEEILGNDYAVGKIREFCRDVNKGEKHAPLMIYGPSGIGKSAAVHILAKENGWNVVELNASDYRDKETVDSRLISAATSRPLMGGRNLILLDEIDEIAARFDKGAGVAIGNLISQAKNPIIFIANDMWNQSITFLRGKVNPIQFKRLMPETVHNVLLNLCKRLSLKANATSVQMISNRAKGDARSAINDMSVIIGTGKDEEMTEAIGLRDRKMDVFNVLDKIFMNHTLSAPLRAIANTDLTNDMLIKWIDENIPKRYKDSDELMAAFDSLAYASMFSTRAIRAQYYTYWRYMNVLMSGGVALAKKRYPDSIGGYAFPKVIKDLSGSKVSRNVEINIAIKLQRVFHSSIRKIVKNEMIMLSKSIAKSIRENADSRNEIISQLAATYLLEEKEIDYILSLNS
jgi:replication factor C large subunit